MPLKRGCLALAAGAVVALAGLQAQAALIPTHIGVAAEGPYYRHTYELFIQVDGRVDPGDYAVVYDFNGFVNIPGSVQIPAIGWTAAQPLTTASPPGTTVGSFDNATVPNLRFNYLGPTSTGVPAGQGQQSLGLFSALSIYPNLTDGFFGSLSHRAAGTSTGVEGEEIGAAGLVSVPVPEPTLAGLACAGILAATARRRRRA